MLSRNSPRFTRMCVFRLLSTSMHYNKCWPWRSKSRLMN